MTTPASTERTSRVRWRFQLVVCCLVLSAATFAQRPGHQVSDTKFDLIIDPGGMLARALHMWDPTAGLGQVQNQAYGYLFPMGPFFWLGTELSVPGWAVQRLWWSLLLVVAFLGVVKLCGALGIGTPTSRMVAGFAYALSPRILTTIGPISIEAWPMALAPWVLVPLVLGCQRGSPRRAATLSALVVAAVGGVNAAATFAVLPLGVVWLLTRARGRRRRDLMAWWPPLVVLGTLWWLGPLLLLGGYSPPFLDFIESASITTIPTTAFDVLRGTSHWVPYVDATWQAGNDLITIGYVALDTAVLVVLGLVGLSLRSNPHRRFLVLGLLLGVVLVSLGHAGAAPGWFAAWEQQALDGLLAPLRNVHKFDPLIRLPLVLGLAHVIGVAATSRGSIPDGQRTAYHGVLVLAVVAVLGVASPVLSGRLAPTGDFAAMPRYWQEASDWLAVEASRSESRETALLVPGSSFASYVWGMPEDEPVGALSLDGWAVRNAVPLAPPGNILMLDAIEERLRTGTPSPGLAGYLRRGGVSRLVVRNDLSPSDDVPPPGEVHQALDGSPGLTRVATFGPTLAFEAARYPAIEVYEVQAMDEPSSVVDPPVVVGGPESLLDLMDADLLGSEPTVLAADDPPEPQGPVLLTDGLRRREATFGRLHEGRSATLSSSDDGRRDAAARAYVLPGQEGWETTAEIKGAEAVDASSSRAFADVNGRVVPSALPFAAFDGQVETAWESAGREQDPRPWVEVSLESPLEVGEVTVVAGRSAGAERDERDERDGRLVVETEAGSSPEVRVPAGFAVRIPVPAGRTTWLRVRAASADSSQAALSIAEVRVEGLDVDRTLVMPEVPAAWGAPDHILVSAPTVASPCVASRTDVRCDTGPAPAGEEGSVLDRTIRLGEGDEYEVELAARPRHSDALEGLIMRDQLIGVTASTSAVEDARGSALAAIDDSLGTTWIAEEDDPKPTLSFNWVGEREVSSLRMTLDRGASADRPTRVEVVHAGGREVVTLDRAGRGAVAPFRATGVKVRILKAAGSGGAVGVSDVRFDGVGLLPVTFPDTPREIGCGFGPTLRVGEQIYATSVTASPRQLFDGGVLPARVCGYETIGVTAGSTRVVVTPAPAFHPVRVSMSLPEPRTAGSPGASQAGHDSLLTMRHNTNRGWEAELSDGRPAEPAVVDGWQQGWWIPAGTELGEVRFAPDGIYRLALGTGAVTLLVLALSLLIPSRRRHAPGLEGARLPWAVPVAGVVTLGLMAGWWGLAAGLLGGVLSVAARGHWPAEVVAWAPSIPLAAAALAYWYRPLGSAEGWAGALLWPQLLVALALGAVVFVDLDHGGWMFRRRIEGTSTTR